MSETDKQMKKNSVNLWKEKLYLANKALAISEEIKGPDDTFTWNFQKMLDNIPHALNELRCSGTRKAVNTRLIKSIK